MPNGIDISNYQDGIPDSVIAQADVIAVKATESIGYVSPAMETQFVQGVNAGKRVGVYHFARPGDPIEQADYFIQQVANQQLYPDFYVLDFEDENLLHDESWALAFLNRVKAITGLPVWFYCYMSPMVRYGYPSIREAGYKHWIAGYPYGPQSGFGAPMSLDDYISFSGLDSSGIDFAGWQYTSQGILVGWSADLDLNYFYDDAFLNTATLSPVEHAIAWYAERVDAVTYSMDMDQRNGPNAYDCSSAVYHSLISAEVLPADIRVGNTESEFVDLPAHGFEPVPLEDDGTYKALRGDVFIWGERGASTGAAGHTGIFIDTDNIVHCNAGYNTISINNHDQIHAANGYPSVTLYRYAEPNEKDWFEMATQDDLKKAIREVLNEPIARQGGEKGNTSIISEAAWRTARDNRLEQRLEVIGQRVFHLWHDMRMGVSGKFHDGPIGAIFRKNFGYQVNEQERANEFKTAEKKGWL